MSEIEEIKKALEKYDEGMGSVEREIFDDYFDNNSVQWLRTLLEENERLVTRIIQHRKALGYVMSPSVQVDPDIINKREKALESQLQQLREELAEEKRHAETEREQANKWLEENGRLRAELDQVKKDAERYKRERDFLTSDEYEGPGGIASRAQDKFAADIVSLRTELAEKDKVLEQIENADDINVTVKDIQENVRYILSQYKGDTTDASKDA